MAAASVLRCDSVLLVFSFCVLALVAVETTAAQSAAVRVSHDDEHELPSWRIVESIPQGMNLTTKESTYEGWLKMIREARQTINIGAFYMDFFNGSQYLDCCEGAQGVHIFDELIKAYHRGVRVSIVLNVQSAFVPYSPDPAILESLGAAEVRYVNWTNVAAGGILHTKIIITDSETVYIGSSNIAWDSLTQVKELGVIFERTPEVALDAQKIWDMYWYLGSSNFTVPPSTWPASYQTAYNMSSPMQLDFESGEMKLFISASPEPLVTKYRTTDLEAILATVNNAQSYVYGEVMDYLPTTLYLAPNEYFAPLDTAFRAAPFNTAGVQVRLLFGIWNQTFCAAYPYLRSLNTLVNVTVRVFRVPDLAGVAVQPPFTRVNHAKFIVTDQASFVTTSNWAGDYFLNTGGMSLNIVSPALSAELTDIFLRDWNSPYAEDICMSGCDVTPCAGSGLNGGILPPSMFRK